VNQQLHDASLARQRQLTVKAQTQLQDRNQDEINDELQAQHGTVVEDLKQLWLQVGAAKATTNESE
jgi:hypothetical protein